MRKLRGDVKVIDIHAREEKLKSIAGGIVYSHDSITETGRHLVQVFGPGMEVGALADTRGEALVELADVFRDLSRELRMMALEQEGAVRLNDPDARPRGGG